MTVFVGMIDKSQFLEALASSVSDVYAIEDNFTLIAIQVKSCYTAKHVQEVFGSLAKSINKSIVNQKDKYSFWNNTFYILTYLDNKQVIQDFLNSLALKLDRLFAKNVCLYASFVQYPYEIIEAGELLEQVEKRFVPVVPFKSDLDFGLINDVDYNQVISKELTNYLLLMKQYGQALFEHSLLVTKISVGLAKALDFSAQSIKKIVIAAILHDIGYLIIPKSLLKLKNHKNMKSIAMIKMHPLFSTRKILKDKTIFKEVFSIIEQHHEYIDGTGYPFGLNDMSVEAQIISIADTYDLIRNQHYISDEEIVNFFTARAGIRWDEKLITIFAAILMDEKQLENLKNANYSSLVDFLSWS
jgi:HD-GYP domain-containing protein (c-di-GMP phosphodiesterase class II)